jgi:signal transduction histidine kinase/ligand-binding sensor domain-containing protein
MRHLSRFLLFICMFWLASNTGFSFPYEYVVYDKKNGFEQSFIYSIIQDKENFLWISTIDGLYRFDGFAFKKFTKDNGLVENLVSCSFADTSGVLYFGHVQGGVTILSENRFKAVNLPGESNPQVVSFIEHENRVLALTRNHGIFLINGDSIKVFLQKEFSNRVCTGMSAFNDVLYISHNEGVSYLDLKGLFNKSHGISEIRQLQDVAVSAIAKQKNGNKLWIATEENGIFEMDQGRHLKATVPPQDIMYHVDVFYEDDANLWIGSKNYGIKKYAYDNVQGRYIIQGTINAGAGFASSQISCIIQDHEYNYWIGSFDKGLIYLKVLPVESYEFKDFEFSEINAVAPWKRDLFLVGTNRGLYQLKHDPLKNEWLAEQEAWMRKFKFTVSALHVNDNGIYVGAIDKGIYFIDKQKIFREIKNNDYLKNSRIKKITEDSLNNIWISASGAGIFKINEESNEVVNYSTITGFIHNEVNDLLVDSNNKLWIGMHANGLSVLHGTDQFFHLTKNGYLAARDINSIREDNLGNIWIATDGMGLYKYNKKFQPIKNFTIEDNLVSNYCSFIIPDEHCLWVGYYYGIDRISYDSDEVERYYTSTRNEFMPVNNTAAINKSGKILIPSLSGFHVLSETRKNYSDNKRQLNLTSWRVNDRDVSLDSYKKNGKLLLSGNKNRLSFDYLTISFEHPANIMYSYRLKEKEGVWSSPSNQRSVALSNLNPGNYVFEVKSFPENNPSDFDILSVRFMIAPPFYHNAWFIVLTTLSMVAFSFIYHRQKTIRIVRQKNQFEKLVVERTREINHQKEEIVSKNEALRTAQMEIIRKNGQLVNLNGKLENLVEERTEKLKNALKELEIFLYHASHDLKGPVARIKGLTMLTQLETNHDQMQSLQLMNAESRHLDFILDKLAKIHSAISLPLEFSKIQFHDIIYQIMEKFRGWDEFLQINWQMDFNQYLEVVSDKDTLMHIIENLVENSIIFQNPDPEKKKIIKISASAKAKHFKIVIEDNGIGIPPSVQDKIFDMYFRGSVNSKGNGLGLYLVEKGVQKLNGKIAFNSKMMEYTRFELFFPIKTNCLVK